MKTSAWSTGMGVWGLVNNWNKLETKADSHLPVVHLLLWLA